MRISIFILILISAGIVNAQDIYTRESKRARVFFNEVKCQVCESQNIAESNSDFAVDMKNLILKKMNDGKSNLELKEYLVNRYGKDVLYSPPFDSITFMLWVGPFLLVAFGGYVIYRITRK